MFTKNFLIFTGPVPSEKDRPTLQSSAEKSNSGIPFNPSAQFALNVARVLHIVQSVTNQGCCILPVNFCHKMEKS